MRRLGKFGKWFQKWVVISLYLSMFFPIAGLPVVRAEVPIISLGVPYTQNFDSLLAAGSANPWADNFTILGWDSSRTTYIAGTGSNTAGALYSFGAASVAERALGSLASGTTSTIYFGVRFKNNTTSTITYLSVSYVGEQWRNAGNVAQQRLNFTYQVNDTVTSLTDGSWTDVNSLDFISPTATTTGTALDGNAAANRTALSDFIVLTLAPGQEVVLRWEDLNDSGSDHGLAIDDLSVTAYDGPIDPAPIISSTDPVNGDLFVSPSDSIRLIFSKPVDLGTTQFTVSCTLSGNHTAAVLNGPTEFTLEPETDFTQGDACTLIIDADLVTDQDTSDPLDKMNSDYVLSFSVAIIEPSIHDIQGATHFSAWDKLSVLDVSGIVTVIEPYGFYLQEPNSDVDADSFTSEGIYVYTATTPTVQIGDAVLVSGTVTEFYPGGTSSDNLSITEINASVTAVVSSGNPLPGALVIGSGGRIPPTIVIEDDAIASFDADLDGLDFYESLEGMLVQVNTPLAVAPTNNYGELVVVGDNGQNATPLNARGGITVAAGDFNPERIFLDDEILKGLPQAQAMPQVNTGAVFSGAVTGVMSYSFGNYKFQVLQAPTLAANGLARQTAQPVVAGRLAVASFNVENLNPSDGSAKFASLANLIVNHLRSPDLITLEEVQDNNGSTNDSVVDANVTLDTLISAIAAAGGPIYSYRQVNPVDDTSGGEPGGNIRVAFLFRTDRGLSFVDRAPNAGQNLSTTPVGVSAGALGPQLSWSPGFVDPTNAAFSASRKPLAGEFIYGGQKIFVVANHFNSKGGDKPLFGRYQPPALSSEAQRIQQAQVVQSFVNGILSLDDQAQVIVLGDLNDYTFSAPLIALKGSILTNLMETLPVAEQYSYLYDGNSQALDHILVSAALNSRLFSYQSVHVNAEFIDGMSDHDPQLAVFDFAIPYHLPVIRVR